MTNCTVSSNTIIHGEQYNVKGKNKNQSVYIRNTRLVPIERGKTGHYVTGFDL